MRIFLIVYVIIIVGAVSILGFRGSITEKEPVEVFSDMDRQAKYKPQAENSFFDNRQNDRLPPTLSVSRGNALDTNRVFDAHYEGLDYEQVLLLEGRNLDGTFSDTFPYEVDNAFMQYGQKNYTIFCASCHGVAGDGNGVTKPYGILAASYHDDRLRNEPDGYIYDVIANGKGLMYGLKDRLNNKQSWSIVLYLRALQKTRNADQSDLSLKEKSELGL
jgi:cytochrome c553